MVVLATDQSYLGRAVVILKRHSDAFSDLKQSELEDLLALSKRLESGYKEVFGATMFNWSCLMNNAYQSETPNPHVHWHLRPRYDHDVEFAGQIFKDREFGCHYDDNKRLEIKTEVQKQIIERIREKLGELSPPKKIKR